MEIDLTTIGFLSSTTKAFLRKENRLTNLIPADHPFFSIDRAIEAKANFPIENRKILVDVLKKQYLALNIHHSEIVNTNIEALLETNTYTVTTGQQLHLFLGPAFMVYKLISTIKTAEEYQLKYTDKKFIPVYWLASEDHDFAEIKNTPLFGQNFEWQTNQTGACGTYHLNELPPLFEELKAKLKNDAFGLNILSEFEGIYKTSKNLSEATIKLTHHLFEQYGLVCLDANNKALKTLFIPVIKKELFERESEKAFNDFSKQMSAIDLSLQLKSREINLFYLKDHIRARITYNDGIFKVFNTAITFTTESLADEIEKNPENFSPNALLRPVYQEMILPNVAYIGGNAEINYWLQLKQIFELHQIVPATLLLRQSLWLIKEKQMDWLKSKNIAITDLFELKSEQDNLSLLGASTDENFYISVLSKFSLLKSETLNQIAKDGLKNLKETSESAKDFERNLKEMVKAKNELLIEKNKKDLQKLEQLLHNGFGSKLIQERTFYTLEFLISVKDYINYCHQIIQIKPGIGYFLKS